MNENLPPNKSPHSPNSTPHSPNSKIPPIGKGVRVRHQGRECLAYIDAQGKWRNYDNGDPLIGEVTILSTHPLSTF